MPRHSIVGEESIANFFNKKINFDEETLKFDRSPVCIDPYMHLCKVHFLFIQLTISTIFVKEYGVLQGIIKKKYFFSLDVKK